MAGGRFAPSPTGPLHLGNLRTALVAWLLARAGGSRFVLRFEDLDAHTADPRWEAAQLDDLRTLGLDWDEPVMRQSARRGEHERVVERLDAEGRLYPCWCSRREVAEAAQAPHGDTPTYPGTCRRLSAAQRREHERGDRPAALRLDARGAIASFEDRWHGTVTAEVDDFVVRRNDGTPAYNLAVVVDDAAQGVEEVTRGDDLLGTTHRQVHLAGLLALPVPTYAHVPLVLGPDGQRLAKRHGAVTLDELRAASHAPAAVLSLLARSLGLHGDSAATLLTAFDPTQLPREPWTLDEATLEALARTGRQRP